MKRSELKRKTALKRGTKGLTRAPFVRRKSKRLRDYEAEFAFNRPLVLARARYLCETNDFAFSATLETRDTPELDRALDSCYGVVCGGTATHVHHRKYRKRGGSNAISNLLATCRAHHDWIHAHGGYGEPANLLGLVLSANESEEL